jgi:hypothetical protein
MKVRELHPRPGKLVQVRRGDPRVSITTDVPVPQIIRHDHDDIGPADGLRVNGIRNRELKHPRDHRHDWQCRDSAAGLDRWFFGWCYRYELKHDASSLYIQARGVWEHLKCDNVVVGRNIAMKPRAENDRILPAHCAGPRAHRQILLTDEHGPSLPCCFPSQSSIVEGAQSQGLNRSRIC